MTLNGVSTTPTSSFPYNGFGPIDFSQINFVRTEQTEYYYGYVTPSSTQEVLLATVKQVNDPRETVLIIAGMILGFFILAIGFIKFIRRQGK